MEKELTEIYDMLGFQNIVLLIGVFALMAFSIRACSYMDVIDNKQQVCECRCEGK